MPKGQVLHGGEVSTYGTKYKTGDADPNSPAPGAVMKTGEDLLPEEKRRVFVQIAAFNALNANSTCKFMKTFGVQEDLTVPQTRRLLEVYQDEIFKVKNAIQIYIETYFPNFNPLQRAQTINDGFAFVEKAMKKYNTLMDSVETKLDDRKLTRLTQGFRALSNMYDSWNKALQDFIAYIDAVAIKLSEKSKPVGKSEKAFLTARKMANRLKESGFNPTVADRVVQVLFYGMTQVEDAEMEDVEVGEGTEEKEEEDDG